MDIQHQIPLFAGLAPSAGGPVYTVPEGQGYRITEIRYKNQGSTAVIFQMGVNGFEPGNLLVEPVSLAVAVGTAIHTYKDSLWLGAGGSIFVGGGSGVYVEVYGIIANVLSGYFDKDGRLIGLRATDDTALEIDAVRGLKVYDISLLDKMDAMLVELGRMRTGIEVLIGEEIEKPREEDHDT